MLKGKKYITYSRCSTEDQRKKGNSHEYQIREIEQFANRNGMINLGTFSDTISGTSFTGRLELDNAYRLCEAMRGEIHYMLTYKMDRFGREVGDALATIKLFRKVGVEVNFTDEWIDYKDPSHPISLSLKLALAQTESLKISDRTKDGIYQNQLNGFYPFNAPVGYVKEIMSQQKANGSHMKICVPHPIKGPIVTKILNQFATGGFTRTELFNTYKKDLGITKNPFYAIFNNRFYSGMIEVKPYKGNPAKIIKGRHQALVSEETFRQVERQLIASQSKTNGRSWSLKNTIEQSEYYLKGSLKCNLTSKRMTAYKVKKKSGKQYAYYSTPNSKVGTVVPVPKAHALVRNAISDFIIPKEDYSIIEEELRAEIQERGHHVDKSLQKVKTDLTRQKTRLEKVTYDYTDGLIDATIFASISNKLQKEVAQLEAQIIDYEAKQEASATTVLQVLALLKDMGMMFDKLNVKGKNQFLRAAFPLGFSINETVDSILTPKTNVIFDVMGCKAEDYNFIKIETGTSMSEIPARGGIEFQLITNDLWLWKPLLTA